MSWKTYLGYTQQGQARLRNLFKLHRREEMPIHIHCRSRCRENKNIPSSLPELNNLIHVYRGVSHINTTGPMSGKARIQLQEVCKGLWSPSYCSTKSKIVVWIMGHRCGTSSLFHRNISFAIISSQCPSRLSSPWESLHPNGSLGLKHLRKMKMIVY